MQQFIIDNTGRRIEVTDLGAAIAQADAFRRLRHVDPRMHPLDTRLAAYWTDMLQKLEALKEEGHGTPQI